MDQLETFFKSLEDYFDKIYVITLSRATDRHQHIKEELKGLKYSLFWGQDKDEFEVKELEKQNIYNEALARQAHRNAKKRSSAQRSAAARKAARTRAQHSHA